MSLNKKLRNAIVAILEAGHGIDMRADLSAYPSEGSFLVECFLGDEQLDYTGLTTEQAQQALEAGEIAEYFPTAGEAADCYLHLCEWLERALEANAALTTAARPKKAAAAAPAPPPSLAPGLADFTPEDLEELDAEPTLVLLLSPLGANDRTQLTTVESLVHAYPDVQFGRIDLIENPEVVSRFQVTASPVCLFFKDGKLVRQLVGVQTEKALRAALDAMK
jgi:Thioredoxin